MGNDDDLRKLFADQEPIVDAHWRNGKPWWVATRSLTGAIALCGIWTAIFVLHVAEAVFGGAVNAIDVILFVVSGVLAAAYAPSIAFFARHSRDRAR